MDITKRFGTRLKRLRADKSWSQEELADQSGLHRTYISSLERGLRNPTLTVLKRLADAFETNVAEMLAGM